MTTTQNPTGPLTVPARGLPKGDVIRMGTIDTVTIPEGKDYVSIRFVSRIGEHGTAFPLNLEVTVLSRCPLPFLLPAANLAIGDTIRTDSVTGVIRSITRCVPGVLTFAFVGDSRTFTCKPGELVERTGHAPVEVLNDVVTALTHLVEEWDARTQRLDTFLRRAQTDGDDLGCERFSSAAEARQSCAAEVRAILDRLQP